MTARYRALVAHDFTGDDTPPGSGLRSLGPAHAIPPDPGVRWWRFEDEGAAGDLDGRWVRLRLDGLNVVRERRVLG